MRRDSDRRPGLRPMIRAALLCASVAGAACSLSACSGDQPHSFPPYQYGYLGQIHLNVASLQTVDHGVPGSVPGDESARAPIPPDQALLQMAQDRLAAAGQDGSAVFTIDHASIVHEAGGTLAGQLDVHLDVLSATGQKLGVAEAHVTRELKPDLDQGNADSPANLYDLTKQMMQDMNVELEFQIRRSLRDWLVDAGGMATDGAIQTHTLDGSPQESTTPGLDTGTPAGTNAPAAPAPTTPDAAPPATNVDGAYGAPTPLTPTAPQSATPTEGPTAPVASPPAESTTGSTPPSAPTEPDAIFPSGAPGDSPGTQPQVLSPKPGVLHLPKAATKTGTSSSTPQGY